MDLRLMDRLKALNFDEEFRRAIKMKPMSRYYFMVEGTTSEQFHVFAQLACWLCTKAGKTLEAPQEDDDPNFTISSILDVARDLGIPVDFSPNKLKQGYGDHVNYLLDRLTDKALQASGLSWEPFQPRPDSGSSASDEEAPDGEMELAEEAVDDDNLEEDFSEDEDGYAPMENEEQVYGWNAPVPVQDETIWKQEVERAGPALRVRVNPTARDWRAHLLQLDMHRQELGKLGKAASEGLSRVCTRAIAAREAARSRDELLATRTAALATRLANLRAQTEAANSSYKAVSGGVTQRQEVLSELTDQVETIKQKTEMKGSAMNDASPIVNIKQCIVTLRKEIQQMDLQLAVLMWSVIEHQSRNKKGQNVHIGI